MLQVSLLAILTGAVAGLGAVLFRGLIAVFHNLFFLGKLSVFYNTLEHTAAGPWGAWIILVPVLGGLMVTFLVKNFAPEAKGHGVPEVIEAIHYKRGVIRPVVSFIKALASAISIGSGAAVGREGPIIQIGSAFGSTVAQLTRVPAYQRLALIGCGAGGGIAATFNTPIGGLLFAVELILPEISARTLIPVALATGTASFVGRLAFGDTPAFAIPEGVIRQVADITPESAVAYLCFGLILGVVSLIYTKSIYGFEDYFDALPINDYLRHSLGMLLSGIMMYLLLRYAGHYYIQGVGYATIQEILSNQLTIPALLLILAVVKLAATALALGSGASGGIFSPSLFIGAALGAVFANMVNHFLPGTPLNAPATAMIGMAGVVAGATGAVITAMVMIFEMTRDYNVVIPLMLVAPMAYGVRRALMHDNIYSLKLTRRGRTLPDAHQTNLYLMYTLRDVLEIPTVRRPVDDPTPVHRFLAGTRQVPHVLAVSEDGHLAGVLTQDVLTNIDPRQHLSQAIADHATMDVLLLRADEILLDTFVRMRDTQHDVALVTETGTLAGAEDIVGVLTWAQIAHTSNLPLSLRQRRNGK